MSSHPHSNIRNLTAIRESYVRMENKQEVARIDQDIKHAQEWLKKHGDWIWERWYEERRKPYYTFSALEHEQNYDEYKCQEYAEEQREKDNARLYEKVAQQLADANSEIHEYLGNHWYKEKWIEHVFILRNLEVLPPAPVPPLTYQIPLWEKDLLDL